MTLDRWLASMVTDANRRALPALVPLLEGLAAALMALRAADFNDDASGRHESARATPPAQHPSR